MARILLSTDFSSNAQLAAEYAIRTLGRTGHEYILLHAFSDLGLTNPMLSSMAAEVYATAKDDLAKAVERLRASTQAEGIVGRMENGPVSLAVRAIAREEGADLVVMGRRGMAGASIFGSNTTDTVRNGDVAVLAVPEKGATEPPAHILLATDLTPPDPDNLAMLRTIALTNKAAVVAVHIVNNASEAGTGVGEDLFNEALQGVQVRFITHPSDDVVDGIVETAQAIGADMITVLHRHRGFIDRLFNPSVTRKLALDSELPLLVLAK
jgi:nucleotide-binding universal stress UspA family protein